MSDVKARLADALREHVWYFVGNLGVPGMPDQRGYKCPCGWTSDGGIDPRAHVADVLLSLPGIAIVDEIAWYITAETFKRGGRVVAGPFPTLEHALRMRQTIEHRGGHLTYWVDKRPWAAANATEQSP